MTEQEYIAVSNRAKINSAIDVVSGVMSGKDYAASGDKVAEVLKLLHELQQEANSGFQIDKSK